MSDYIGALILIAAAAGYVTATVIRACIARARRNAQVRAARRQHTTEALELALMRREFDAIVAQLKADA